MSSPSSLQASTSPKSQTSKMSRAKGKIAILFSTGKSQKKSKGWKPKSQKRYSHYLNKMVKKQQNDASATATNPNTATQLSHISVHRNVQVPERTSSVNATVSRPYLPGQLRSTDSRLPRIQELPFAEAQLERQDQVSSPVSSEADAPLGSWAEGVFIALAQTTLTNPLLPTPAASDISVDAHFCDHRDNAHPGHRKSLRAANNTVIDKAEELELTDLPDLPELEGDFQNTVIPQQKNIHLEEIERLRRENVSLQKNVCEKDVTITQMQAAQQKIEGSLEAQCEAVEGLVKANSNTKSKLSQLSAEKARVEEELKTKEAQLQEAHASLEDSKIMKTALDEMKGEKAELEQVLEQEQVKHRESQKKRESTATELEKAMGAKVGLEEELAQVKAQLQEAQASLQQSDHDKLILGEQLESERRKAEGYGKSYGILTDEHDKLQEKNDGLEEDFDEVQAELDELRTTFDRVSADLTATQEREVALTAECKTANTKTELLKFENNTFRGSFYKARGMLEKETNLRNKIQSDFAARNPKTGPYSAIKLLVDAHQECIKLKDDEISTCLSKLEQYANMMHRLEHFLDMACRSSITTELHNERLIQELQRWQAHVPAVPLVSDETLTSLMVQAYARVPRPAGTDGPAFVADDHPQFAPSTAAPSAQSVPRHEGNSAKGSGMPPPGLGPSGHPNSAQFPLGFGSSDQGSSSAARGSSSYQNHASPTPHAGSSSNASSRTRPSNGDARQQGFAQSGPSNDGSGPFPFTFSTGSQQQQRPRFQAGFAQRATSPNFANGSQDGSSAFHFCDNSPRHQGESSSAGAENSKKRSKFASYFEAQSDARTDGGANGDTGDRSFDPAPGGQGKRTGKGRA